MGKRRKKSGNPDKNSRFLPYRNMNQQFTQDLSRLGDFLQDEGDLGIIIGNHQNLDTVASALALYLSLSQSGKNVQLVSLKEPLVEVSDLVGVDKIKSGFSGGTSKLVVSLPYTKGEVEKVLFTEQPNTINFHLTAAPGKSITQFDLNKVKLNWEGSSPKAIISVGVGNPDELNGLVDVASSNIVNIDNYPNNSRFGSIVLVDDMFSSLSEMVGKILKDLRFPLDQDIAQNILDGILFATKNFTKGNTSPLAFEMASYVMYQGAQRKPDGQRPQENRSQQRQPQMNQSQKRPTSQINQSQNRQSRPYDVVQRPKQDIPFGSSAFNPYQGDDLGQSMPPVQPRDSRGSQGQNRNKRVQDNDFPAMHIQDIRTKIANDNKLNKQDMSKKGFDQSKEFSRNEQKQPQVNDFPEERTQNSVPADFEDIQNESPQMNQPQDFQDQSFNNNRDEDVPDDWLMPKVFKSSRNNN